MKCVAVAIGLLFSLVGGGVIFSVVCCTALGGATMTVFGNGFTLACKELSLGAKLIGGKDQYTNTWYFTFFQSKGKWH